MKKNLTVAAFLFLLICLVVKLTARDAYFEFSHLYYIPSPIVFSFVLAFVAFLWKKKSKIYYISASIALFCLALWFYQTLSFKGVEAHEKTCRIMFWNTFWGNGGWERIVETVRESDADIVVMVESDSNPYKNDFFWWEKLPNYKVHRFGQGIVMMIKGSISKVEYNKYGNSSRLGRANISVNRNLFTLYVADVSASFLNSRKNDIESLFEMTKDGSKYPRILVGDFNTPPESVFFDKLREDYKNAFEVAGIGYSKTWPTTSPVLHLDHIWVSKDIDVISCHHPWTTSSDHRPVIAEIKFYE